MLVLIAVVVVAAVAGITVWVIADTEDTATPTAAPSGPSCSVAIAPTNGSGEAPVFQAPGLRGGCVELARYEGRPLVVNFWASYCNPCRKEFPLLKQALEQHRDEGLQIIGVSHDDIDDDARAFADEFDATWPLALDPDNAIAEAFVLRPDALPHTYFVRRDGTISADLFRGLSRKELDQELEKILRDPPA